MTEASPSQVVVLLRDGQAFSEHSDLAVVRVVVHERPVAQGEHLYVVADEDERMGSYSIYIIFPQDLDGQKSRIRVCAGQVASKKKALELAYDLLYEEGGGIEAVDVIDWQSHEKTFISRIVRPDGPEAA